MYLQYLDGAMDPRMIHGVYLSLGSNLGNRESYLRDAIARLGTSEGRIAAVSSFYETEPVEVTDQNWFLNCALKLETSNAPEQLLSHIIQIERDMGRRRTRDKGPRTIDIDVLLFDDAVMNTPELTIPHPAMARRRFVLEPLAEIAPEQKHPGSGKTVRDLLWELPPGQIVRRSAPSTAEPTAK